MGEREIEFLDSWLHKNFSLTLDEFYQKIKSKPLREMIAAFNSDNSCSHKCKHCFMCEDIKNRNMQSVADVYVVLEAEKSKAAYKKDTYIYLQDPERNLEKLYEVLKVYPQKFLEIDPAVFIDNPKAVSELKKLGVQWIAHSIHGDYPESHLLTGQTEKEWKNRIKGFKLAKEEGFRIEISSCFYSENINKVNNLTPIIDSISHVDSWSINRILPVGRARNWPVHKFLFQDSCGEAIRNICRSFKTTTNIKSLFIDVTWGPIFFGSTMNSVLGKRDEIERGIYNCHISSDALLGLKNFWFSRYTGDIFPCIYSIGYQDVKIGSYVNGTIHLDQDRLQKFLPENRINKLLNKCSSENCQFSPICVGCPAVSYSVYKKLNNTIEHSSNVGMDFCITEYITKNKRDKVIMDELSSIIEYKP